MFDCYTGAASRDVTPAISGWLLAASNLVRCRCGEPQTVERKFAHCAEQTDPDDGFARFQRNSDVGGFLAPLKRAVELADRLLADGCSAIVVKGDDDARQVL